MKLKAKEIAAPIEEPPVDILEEGSGNAVGEDASLEPPAKKEKRWNTTKIIVWICLFNGFAWVWCSYILAWLGKEQIAESLSQVAVTEIIGVVLVYCLKAAIENLSKNNHWPDKTNPSSDDDSAAMG